MAGTVYLIPTVLHEGQTTCLPAYLLTAIQQCNAFFVENERTARRYLKSLWKEMVIDHYEWYAIKEITDETLSAFAQKMGEGKTIGVLSEAGCPGVADPGQRLVAKAHELNVAVKPLVGPSSILLALMASGLNGQQFQFVGYLPIEGGERTKAIRHLETDSAQKRCTQIFIETPYRNNQLVETVLKACKPSTQLCIAANLTAPTETVKTKTVAQWKGIVPDLHKQPAIFCLLANKSS